MAVVFLHDQAYPYCGLRQESYAKIPGTNIGILGKRENLINSTGSLADDRCPYIFVTGLTHSEPKFKLTRPQQLLKEAQSRNPQWQVKRLKVPYE